MDVLTRERAKPALPYGGVHRLIDFTLSSFVHAHLHDVWVSVEYQVASIDERQVRAVPLDGYWRDLGRPEAYLQGHRDLLSGKVDVYDPAYPIISKWPDRSAARVRRGARVDDSLVSPGCDVAGEVRNSVLGPGVVVEAGALVEDCVLFDDVHVANGAQVRTAIVDERSRIGLDARVGESPTHRVARREDIVLVGQDSQVRRRTTVGAGIAMEPGTFA